MFREFGDYLKFLKCFNSYGAYLQFCDATSQEGPGPVSQLFISDCFCMKTELVQPL